MCVRMESNKLWSRLKLILSPVMILEGFKVQGKWKRRQKSAESVIDFVPWKNSQICFRNCQMSPNLQHQEKNLVKLPVVIFWFDLLLWILESSKLTKFEFLAGQSLARFFFFSLSLCRLCPVNSRTLNERKTSELLLLSNWKFAVNLHTTIDLCLCAFYE